jgi:uncharacterized tellurite resistance protein B-like protein
LPFYIKSMFTAFLHKLTAPAPEPLNDSDARLALTALLVRIARSDGDYAASEIARIDRISMARYGLSTDQAAGLRAKAEQLESEAPDTVRFTNAIKDAVPYVDRVGVIEALWQVALSDGQRDHNEDRLLRMVSRFLGINDRDSALARQRMDRNR